MKLMLAYHLRSLDETTLARQILEEQYKMEWPGLATEVKELCQQMNITDIVGVTRLNIKKNSWKKWVKEKVHEKNTEDLKKKMENMSKLEAMKGEKKCELKSYIQELTMKEARLKFKVRTKMFPCKFNFQNDPVNIKKIWKCDDCNNVDTQAHILWCPAYKNLREGKSVDNDKDLIEYFQKVYSLRTKEEQKQPK